MKLYVIKKYQKSLIKTKSAVQRVLSVLCRYPNKEFSLSDLAKEAGIAKANIGLILSRLQKEELIEITKLARIWRIKANQQNPYFIRRKILINLDIIFHSGIIDFLKEYYSYPKAIILFGSFRKGEDLTGSDIDIAIETEEIKDYRIERLKELSDLEKKFERKIQIHLFNRKYVDINVFNNIANGIVLSGFLEVKP